MRERRKTPRRRTDPTSFRGILGRRRQSGPASAVRSAAGDLSRWAAPCFLPGVKTTLNNEGFARAPYFLREPRFIADRSRAALAMKDDRLAVVQRKLSLLKPGQWQMVRSADFLPGVLIRLTDVDQDCALTQKALGFPWTDFWK